MPISASTLKDIRNGALVGAVLLALALPMASFLKTNAAPSATASAVPDVAVNTSPLVPDFGEVTPTDEARELVQWIARTRDNAGMPFVVVDKRAARLHVFDPAVRLRDSTAVLLGSAPGDDSVPGIGQRPVHEVQPHERTTPAGRFVGQFGHTLTGEDVVWVDYGAAVSMHRVRPTLQPKEQRAERLASERIDDNRISYGCINVPAAFYDTHIQPVFSQMPAMVYVLPEHKTVQEVFGLRA